MIINNMLINFNIRFTHAHAVRIIGRIKKFVEGFDSEFIVHLPVDGIRMKLVGVAEEIQGIALLPEIFEQGHALLRHPDQERVPGFLNLVETKVCMIYAINFGCKFFFPYFAFFEGVKEQGLFIQGILVVKIMKSERRKSVLSSLNINITKYATEVENDSFIFLRHIALIFPAKVVILPFAFKTKAGPIAQLVRAPDS